MSPFSTLAGCLMGSLAIAGCVNPPTVRAVRSMQKLSSPEVGEFVPCASKEYICMCCVLQIVRECTHSGQNNDFLVLGHYNPIIFSFFVRTNICHTNMHIHDVPLS